MEHHDPASLNPLARLTSFTCEKGSDRIENFCTELLAWSLIKSENFRKKFLENVGFTSNSNFSDFKCHTQYFYTNGNDKGYFDLFIQTSEPSDSCVVEVKVSCPLRDSQLTRYKNTGRRLATVTPFIRADKKEGDHVTWSQIEKWLRETAPRDGDTLMYFADFLKSRGLSSMDMKPISNDLLSRWHNFASEQYAWLQILDDVASIDSVKKLLSPHGTKAPFQYEPTTGRSWIGTWYRNKSVDTSGFYLGVGFREKKLPALWAEVEAPTKFGRIFADPDKLPGNLPHYWRNAVDYKLEGHDHWVNQEQSSATPPLDSNSGTVFVAFIQPLTPEYNGNADKVRSWFREVITETHLLFSKQ
jgi:hypothetical protein